MWNIFLNKARTIYWFSFFLTLPVPPSPGQKEIFVKSERLVNKELNRRQAHWFVEICQSLSGWLHICLRNNSYLYSARAAGQALAVWRRSASVRGFLVGIPNDSPTSHWEGGEKPCLLCWWGTELWSFSFSLDLAWGLGSQSWSQQALFSHTHTHPHTHTQPLAGLCRQISVTALTEAQSNKHSRTNLHGGKRGHWRWQQWRRIFLLTSFR